MFVTVAALGKRPWVRALPWDTCAIGGPPTMSIPTDVQLDPDKDDNGCESKEASA